ncbi:hypothetical protein OSL60_29455, partial [Escherichia coli]|nr:hypothetical protein [Escherichia coli]
MDEIGRPWEAIFVNDGSRDASGELLPLFRINWQNAYASSPPDALMLRPGLVSGETHIIHAQSQH